MVVHGGSFYPLMDYYDRIKYLKAWKEMLECPSRKFSMKNTSWHRYPIGKEDYTSRGRTI